MILVGDGGAGARRSIASGNIEHFLFWGHMEIKFVRRMWRLCGGGMLNLADEEELPVDKYPFYHIYGSGWGMKGQAAPAVLSGQADGGCVHGACDLRRW
jgi:hypothetical protein